MTKPAWRPCFSAPPHLDRMAYVGVHFSRTSGILDHGIEMKINSGLHTIWLWFRNFQEHFLGSSSFSLLFCPWCVRTDLFHFAVKQKVDSHHESIKSLSPFSGGAFIDILRAKGMGIIDGSSSLPPDRQESLQLSNDHKLAMIMENRIFKITSGVALIDWILWKSLGNNCPTTQEQQCLPSPHVGDDFTGLMWAYAFSELQ